MRDSKTVLVLMESPTNLATVRGERIPNSLRGRFQAIVFTGPLRRGRAKGESQVPQHWTTVRDWSCRLLALEGRSGVERQGPDKKAYNSGLALLVQVKEGPEDNGWAAVITA